jgi:hypothetical protein
MACRPIQNVEYTRPIVAIATVVVFIGITVSWQAVEQKKVVPEGQEMLQFIDLLETYGWGKSGS